MTEPVREKENDLYQCCCVIIRGGEEDLCPSYTTGPDDPFCETCTPRHPMMDEPTKVTARMRDRSS